MTQPNDSIIASAKAPNSPLLWLLALVSLVALAAALTAMVITARSGAWLTFAFQGTVIVAATLGAFMGLLKKFTDAPSIGAICIAGTLFVAGFLGYYAAGGSIAFRALLSGDLNAFNTGELPDWVLFTDVLASGVITAIAGLFALGRDPKESWKQLAIGVALGAPVIIGAAIIYKAHLIQRIGSLNMIVSTLIAMALFILVIGLISASVNAFIKAFSAGLDDLPQTDQGASTAPPSAKTASKTA